ncbi:MULTISPECIES: hypothetical protein [Burkholderia]|uniref:Uncharacterized protein n=1 Tax=Burkholderia sola TaxID=2843302 RepID=A0ABV2CHY8_9BURK|nr:MULTISPECIES: hypothetical protein [Burkholderia]KWU29249.1 hypothetical protein AS149_02910 [Burkholderia cenocepacia]MBP0610728.1 hypothetical protein [Burkholderia sp. CpTa8-5]MBP0716850.1 hypothetical protein [Burkholderia sp. AcTa6-5]OXI75930.1 hypothetical protein CFB44_05590 [Burkholderia sp. AU31280]QRR12922.1 hypothetical protein GJG85_05710 [Burkholderia sp. MS389]
MTSYYVDFNNDTKQTWTMAVYQTLPSSIGLESVSWKQTTVPQSGASGVTWDIFYNVAIANYQQIGGIGVYKASQTLTTELGTSWDCIFKDNVQQLVPGSGSVPPDSVLINNKSTNLANLGIGMSGQGSVFKKGVVSGASAQFQVTPTYWVGLFNSLVLGEVISSNVVVGPLQLSYPSGQNLATVNAYMDGNTIKLNVTYGQQVAVENSVVDRIIAAQPTRSGILLEYGN